MARFAEYQRKMWSWLSFLAVCRFYIVRDKHGNYVIKKKGRFTILIYYFIWLNSFVKLVYLLLTYHGWLVKVGFLDQMSMWDWFLCIIEIIQETLIWYGKYPLYEILIANWKIQEEIFRKLGSPEEMQNKIVKICRRLVIMHTAIVIFGCGAILVQFFTAPKFASNLYAIVPYDNWPLRVIFAFHEFVFMWHAWANAASAVVICEVFAVAYSPIILEMVEVMKRLSRIGELKDGKMDLEVNNFEDRHQINSALRKEGSIKSGQGMTRISLSSKKQRFIKDRKLESNTIVPGTEYNITGLLEDYKNLMLATREFNKWVGKIIAGIVAALYAQFVTDVFMMIQLLKEPETDFMAVCFYFADASAGMIMMFLMMILMSRMHPASIEFLEAYKTYLQNDIPIRKYLLKYQKTLRIVSAKIGGKNVRPETVPEAIHALLNYYIGAAMWKRPVDRLT